MSDYQTITWKQDGPVGIITLNIPDKLNALSLQMQDELHACVDALKANDEVRVLIITGAGTAFCAGGDVQGFLARAKAHHERGGARELFVNHLSKKFLSVEIPIIAAINGPAVGGGFTLTLTCDLRLAAPSARFGAVFARVGLSPEYGSSFLLSRIVGITKANELVLTARVFDAEEALQIGLLNEVVPEDRLMDRAMEFARQITALPPVAVRMAKRTLRHGLECTLSQALDYEEVVETHCFSSLDHQEAVEAFLEKREPRFRGY